MEVAETKTNPKNFLSRVTPSARWGFANLTRKQTGYVTHGYHRYPAKYIPQLAHKLITENSKEGDFVIDPFGGCGTTAIEAKISRRRALVIDINPVAVMISSAKINAIKPQNLERAIERFWRNHDAIENSEKSLLMRPYHSRIDYWFQEREKIALAKILLAIEQEKEKKCRGFLTCAFSNILKNCSMWAMRSNKPLYDSNKTPADPVSQFTRQLRAMKRMNADYYDILEEKSAYEADCHAKRGSAEKISVDKGDADLVVTSPPYVTSYEYADLHQLSALWLTFTNDLLKFRRDFIGSSYARRNDDELNSDTATDVTKKLKEKNSSLGLKASVYFADMNRVFKEMHRVLRHGGRACIVIGDTELRGVKIRNTQVFAEQMENLGFRVLKVVARRVISKCIPATRDSKTGKFSSVKKSDKISYPVEYIIVAEKG